jgi:hypothetical protein
MFQSSMSNILSRFDTKPVKKSELSKIDIESTEEPKSSGYNWKILTKAGLVFAITTGGFLALKATGSFSLISSWLKNMKTDFNDQETKFAVSEVAEGMEAYSGYSDFKELSLAAVKDSHEHITFMPQKAKRNPAEILEKIGPEFQVNTYVTNYQGDPSVAGLSNGKFVVTWNSYWQDASDSYGIYGQMFNANGTKFLSEFQVNTYTMLNQMRPSVAGLSDGKFVVTWQSNGQDGDSYGIYGQMFNPDGSRFSSEFQVNTYTADSQYGSSVAGLSDGKFVVIWQSRYQDGDEYGVYGQMFNADGSKYSPEFQINTYTTWGQKYPSVAGLSDGKFVVTWESYDQVGSNLDIYGQMFNADGSRYLSEFQMNTYTTSQQKYPSVVGLNDGKFVVTWQSYGQDGSYEGVYGQIFNTNGTKYSSEFLVNTYIAGWQQAPSVASLSDGKFVITWENWPEMEYNLGIYGQIFNADGSKFLSEFQVNTYTVSDQRYPSVAGLSDGKFVVTWSSNGQDGDSSGIYGQMFMEYDSFASSYFDSSQRVSEFSNSVDSSSVATSVGSSNCIKPVTEIFKIANHTDSVLPAVASLPNNKFVVVWSSTYEDSVNYNLYGRIYNVDGTPHSSTFQVNTYTNGWQGKYSSVAGFSNSKILVIWGRERQNSTGSDIYGQWLEEDGNKLDLEFPISVDIPYPTYWQDNPKIAVSDNNNYAISWQGDDASDYGIYGQCFAANGTKVGSQFQVNTYTIAFQSRPSIAALSNESYVVIWDSEHQDGDPYYNCNIYGQRFDKSGNRIGGEFLVNTYTIDDQRHSAVTSLSNGDSFAVVWKNDQPGSSDIYGQRFVSNGTKAGSEFRIGAGYNPSITNLSYDRFAVLWLGTTGQLHIQQFLVNGTKFGIEESFFLVPIPDDYAVASLPNGNFIVVWDRFVLLESFIYGQLFSCNSSILSGESLSSLTNPLSTESASFQQSSNSIGTSKSYISISDTLETSSSSKPTSSIGRLSSLSDQSASRISGSSSTVVSSPIISSSQISPVVSSSYQTDSLSPSSVEDSSISSTKSIISELSSSPFASSSNKKSSALSLSSNLVSPTISSSHQAGSVSSSETGGSPISSTKSILSKLGSSSIVSNLSKKSSSTIASSSNPVSSPTSSRITQDSSTTQSNIDSNTISSLGLEDSDEGSLPGKIWRILGPVLGLLGPSMLGLTGFAIQRHINRIDKFKKKYPLAANLLGVRKYSLLTKASKEFVKFIHRPTNGLVDKLKSRKVDYDSYLGDDQRLIRELVSNEIGDLAQRSNLYWIFNQKAIIQAISVLDRQSDDIVDRIVKNFNRRITVVSVGVPITVPSTSATPCSADEVVVTEVRPSNLAQEEIQTNYALELSKADQSLQQALGEDLSNKYNSYESEQKAAENESDEESSQRTLSL